MFSLKNIFRHKSGRCFDYIKEIKSLKGITVLRLKGAVDAQTIPIIMRNRRRCTASQKKALNTNILLDFKSVVHIDSATLAALVQLLRHLTSKHKKLGIINMSPTFKRYLSLTRLNRIIQVYETEKQAVDGLG